jgi:hypothetical protein
MRWSKFVSTYPNLLVGDILRIDDNLSKMTALDRQKDLRDIGIYTASEVARYLHTSVRSVRAAVFGSRSKAQNLSKPIEPLIRLPEPAVRLLSFTNLIELYLLHAMGRDRSISLESLR